MACCRYNTTSPCRHVHAGVPKCSCIPHVLFNIYVTMSPLIHTPCSSPHHMQNISDSFFSPNIPIAADALSIYASQVGQRADERNLSISTPKSTISLFTPDTHQSHSHPVVSLNNTPLPLERQPRIIGSLLTHTTFTPHISSIVHRTTSRLNIMRALAGTTWGQSK